MRLEGAISNASKPPAPKPPLPPAKVQPLPVRSPTAQNSPSALLKFPLRPSGLGRIVALAEISSSATDLKVERCCERLTLAATFAAPPLALATRFDLAKALLKLCHTRHQITAATTAIA